MEFRVESLSPCHVVPVHVEDVELRHQGECGVEGADHPLRLGFEVGAVGNAARFEHMSFWQGEDGVVEKVLVGELWNEINILFSLHLLLY